MLGVPVASRVEHRAGWVFHVCGMFAASLEVSVQSVGTIF